MAIHSFLHSYQASNILQLYFVKIVGYIFTHEYRIKNLDNLCTVKAYTKKHPRDPRFHVHPIEPTFTANILISISVFINHASIRIFVSSTIHILMS